MCSIFTTISASISRLDHKVIFSIVIRVVGSSFQCPWWGCVIVKSKNTSRALLNSRHIIPCSVLRPLPLHRLRLSLFLLRGLLLAGLSLVLALESGEVIIRLVLLVVIAAHARHATTASELGEIDAAKVAATA